MTTVIIILTIIIVALTIICAALSQNIKEHQDDFHTIMHNVWQLQDKYNIPDEVIRGCFILDNEN